MKKLIAVILIVLGVSFGLFLADSGFTREQSLMQKNRSRKSTPTRTMPNLGNMEFKEAPLPSRDQLAKTVEFPHIPLVDVTEESGIDFVHERGLSPERLFPETMGSGCAVVDFNGDNLPDLLFVNGTAWPWAESDTAPTTLSAWQNQGDMKFTNVTKELGLDVSLYGMGVAVGDYDNDSDPDIYITAVGANKLFRNDDGRYTDVSEESGTAGSQDAWGISAGWFDYDNDGDLDLLVGNYLTWSRELELELNETPDEEIPRYGTPKSYEGAMPYLYRNDGDGKFVDVAEEVGLYSEPSKAMGLVICDVNHDLTPDIYVANDAIGNQLFLNVDGKFSSEAKVRGCENDKDGNSRAGMGTDVAWYRNTQDSGITVGNYEGELIALHTGHKAQWYTDQASDVGIGDPSRLPLTWDVRWEDMNLDGRLDLLAANGHVEDTPLFKRYADFVRQKPLLFWNRGPDKSPEFIRLEEDDCGEDFFSKFAGRTFATADFDRDGDIDIVLTQSGGPARIFRNDLNQKNAGWLQVRLVGKTSNRDAIGAVIEVEGSIGTQRRYVSSARGYLTSTWLTQTFGFGESETGEEIKVIWPDGTEQTVAVEEFDREYVIEQDGSTPPQDATN